MITDNQKVFNRLLVVLDAIITAVSLILGYVLKFYVLQKEPGPGVLPLRDYVSLLVFIIPGYVLVYYQTGVYTPKRTVRRRLEIFDIIKANTFGMAALIIVIYLVMRELPYARSVLALFYVLNCFLTGISRILLRRGLQTIRKKGYNIKHILLVGYSRAAEGYISRILDNPQWGYVIAGVLDDFVPIGTSYHGIEVIGNTDKLASYLENNQFDEITITLPLNDYDRLEEFVAQCEKSGVHTKFIPDYSSLFPSNPYTEDVQGIPVINIRYVPLTNSFNRLAKRMVDIIGSLIGIILCSPVMFVVAFLIKSTDNGPILFKQERVGLNGKTFNMYKFRSMRVQTESEEKKGWTTKDDPRVTTIGKFIRKTSIDELPQLFNILIGQMSIVGPRPERPQFVEKFKEEIPRYMVKHQVRPGLTGWAQINGYRGDTSIRKRIEYDLYYIENWSMMFDFKIIIGTIRYGIVNKNAY